MIAALPPRGSQPIGADQQFTLIWWGWFSKLAALLKSGYTGTIVTAKLTTGGANGSITFTNGVVTAQTAAT